MQPFTHPFNPIQYQQPNQIQQSPHMIQSHSIPQPIPSAQQFTPQSKPISESTKSVAKDLTTTPLTPAFQLGLSYTHGTIVLKEKMTNEKGTLYEVAIRENDKGFDIKVAAIWRGSNGGWFSKLSGPDYFSFNNQYYNICDWVKSQL